MRTEERVSIGALVDPDDHERLVERARLGGPRSDP
jgi:hypothetical protein